MVIIPGLATRCEQYGRTRTGKRRRTEQKSQQATIHSRPDLNMVTAIIFIIYSRYLAKKNSAVALLVSGEASVSAVVGGSIVAWWWRRFPVDNAAASARLLEKTSILIFDKGR